MTEQKKTRPRRDGKRERAMAAARSALAERRSYDDAAQEAGVSLDLVHSAGMVLRYGTPEEIAEVDTGARGLLTLAKVIHARVPPEVRQRKKQIVSADNREARKLNAKIWEQLNLALDTINALPRPTDVIHTVRKHHKRVSQTERKLANAYAWIEEFSDAWTK